MKEVTMAEFYAAIGPQIVTLRSTGRWPYTTEFVGDGDVIRGRKVGHATEWPGMAAYRYYLPDIVIRDPQNQQAADERQKGG